jgi:hypothetical protein
MESTKTIPRCQVCGKEEVEGSTHKKDKQHKARLVREAIDIINKRMYFDF